MAQIPLFSFADEKVPDDIIQIINRYWKQFYSKTGPRAFGPEHLRYGFTDLKGDGGHNLILLVNHSAWESGDGYVMLLGAWSKNLNRWLTIGWGWGDPDTIFGTDQVIDGWQTLDTGSQYLAWNGTIYKNRKKLPVTIK